MITASDQLAYEIADLRRQVEALSRGSQLSRSSLVVDGEVVTIPGTVRSVKIAKNNATVALDTANGKNSVTYSVDEPGEDGTAPGDIWFRRDVEKNTIIGVWEWTGSAWDSTSLGDEVLDSLTVGKLVSGEIAAGVRIIAGPADKTHAEMSSLGFRVFAADPNGGEPTEVIRMGTDTDDFFGITDENGVLIAAIDKKGVGRFTQITTNNPDPIFGGTPLSELMWDKAWGLVGVGELLTEDAGLDYWGAAPKTDTEIGLMEFSFTAKPGRVYTLTSEPFEVWCDTGDSAYLRTRMTTDGSQPLVSTPWVRQVVARARQGFSGSNTFNAILEGPKQTEPTTENPTPAPVADQTYRLLFTYGVAGSTGVRLGTHKRFRFYINDIGPTRPLVGRYSTGGGATQPTAPPPPPPPPPAPRVTRTDTWLATWARSWRQGGQAISFDNVMYQGYGDSFNGIQVSACGFPDLVPALSGADIHKVEIYLYCEHAYYNDGVDLNIQGHNVLWAPPGPPTYTGEQTGGPIVRFGKPEGKWVDITYWRDGWQSGMHRGLVLHPPGNSGDRRYYGRVSGLSNNTPSIRITYTK